MADSYLQDILGADQQKKISSGGIGLTPQQMEAAYQGDISARYQDSEKGAALAVQQGQLALSQKTEADQLKTQDKQANISQTQSIISGVGAAGTLAKTAYDIYSGVTGPATETVSANPYAGAGSIAYDPAAADTAVTGVDAGTIASEGGAAAASAAGTTAASEAAATGAEAAVDAEAGAAAAEAGASEGAADVVIGYIADVVEAIAAACIIVTVCTNGDKYKINITREYRDKFMSPVALRGYYIIASKVVPWISENTWLKKTLKVYLVDNLIEYGTYALGKTEIKPSLKSVIITKTFLGLCSLTGMTRTHFIRANGEVY